MEEGLVERAGVAPSSGGRKPVVVRLVPEARYSFGVSVSPDHVYIVLINLMAEEVVRSSFAYCKADVFEDVLKKIKAYIEQIIEANVLDRKKIMGIGLAFPGLVNDDTITLDYIPNLKIKNYCLRDFEDQIGLKIYAENEANAAAYAEQVVGAAKGNFVYVSIAEGIGTGIIIENHIYKGKQKKAGEFGHIKVSDEKSECNCGRTGCWELFASQKALLRYFEEYNKQPAYCIDDVFFAYRQGDKEAIKAITKYTRYLFAGIENILLSVNPDYVIVGGDLGEYAQTVIDVGVKKLKLTERFYGYKNIQICCSGLKDNGAVIGAALLPLEEIFNYQKNVI